MEPQNLKATIVSIAGQIDRQVDWRPQLKSFGLLALCAFSLFFLFMAPFEIWQVRKVNSWVPLPARLVTVSQERSAFRKGNLYWRYDIELKETGERVVTSDVRPGDLPMTIIGWSTSDRDAVSYHNGQNLEVFRAPEGGKVYLERGSFGFMATIFAAAMSFWMVMIALILKRRAGAVKPNLRN